MRKFAIFGTLLVLLGLFALPTASAGCNVTQTCAVITGSSSCRIPPGSCTGTWTSHHRSLFPGVGLLFVDGVLVGSCPVTPLGCTNVVALAWNCTVTSHHIEAYTITTVDTAYDDTWTYSC